uniref:Uncharacterized protein n=1 Tax=Rhizophora mucronata TaxID=61149 RepID=A0A2P2ISV1_RHIMU
MTAVVRVILWSSLLCVCRIWVAGCLAILVMCVCCHVNFL